MADPNSVSSPFQPRPAGVPGIPPPPGSPSRGGCSRPLLVGCAVALVLLGIGAVVFLVKAPSIAQWAFTRMEAEVVSRLPADLPREDRERLERAFAAVRQGLESGKVEVANLQPTQAKLLEVAGKPPGQVTREDVQELTESLERLAGIPATPPPPAPQP